MGFDGLWKQQNRNAEQAETGDGRQHGVGVGSHHFASRELLLAVVDHASLVFGSSYGQLYVLIGLKQRG